ncbi:MAG: polysaccharide export protein [bacterium]|nr:polysaccharide export protein [bacterium]
MHRIPKLALSALALGALLACATTDRPTPPPAEAPVVRSEYVIGLGDQLQITVWRNEELSGIRLVRTDGKISVPLVDDIQAEGLTPEQLKAAIAEKLEDFISAPDVTVAVAQANSKQVYILGEVLQSGPVPVLQDLRVTDAISLARGFGPFADRSDIRIVRREGHEEIEYLFDYDAYVRGRAAGTNILLQPGDTVIVPD